MRLLPEEIFPGHGVGGRGLVEPTGFGRACRILRDGQAETLSLLHGSGAQAKALSPWLCLDFLPAVLYNPHVGDILVEK